MVYTVGRLSIYYLAGLFLIYLILHLLIAYREKRVKQEIEEGDKSSEKLKEQKMFIMLNKWFPAIYVIFLLVLLYFG